MDIKIKLFSALATIKLYFPSPQINNVEVWLDHF